MKLNEDLKRSVQLALCSDALGVWNEYAEQNSPITYIETVVGTELDVSEGLPAEAYKAAVTRSKEDWIRKAYLEPICALQDDDLEFPEHITYAYYAIYNLYCRYSQNESIDDWLIVNQALSAKPTDDEGYRKRFERILELIEVDEDGRFRL